MMKRATLQGPLRSRGSVCQLCRYSISSASRRSALRSQPLSLAQKSHVPSRPIWRGQFGAFALRQGNGLTYRFASTNSKQPAEDPESMLQDVLKQSRTILSAQTVPEQKPLLDLLQLCRSIVDISLSEKHPINASQAAEEDSATSSLLDLDNGSKRKPAPKPTNKKTFRQKAATSISSVLNDIVRDPKIFLFPELLTYYTEIQCRLGNADHIPEVFTLYATKPAPQAKGSEIIYHKTSPNSAKNAIPKDLADKALEVALEQKNMALALAIVDASYCRPAFKNDKILRKAGLPIAGLIAAPPAAYVIASYLATLQETMAQGTATWMAFAAIMAYIGVTSSVGLVAITTANDQMERVSWLPGTPLRQRWLREDEREGMDKIAQAWGFKDPAMRGEEEGQDWENLREILGMRGMVLDKTELMEGME